MLRRGERGECELMQAAKVADAYALLMGSLGSRGRGSQYPVRSSSGEGFGGVGGKPTRFTSKTFIIQCTAHIARNLVILSKIVDILIARFPTTQIHLCLPSLAMDLRNQ